MTFEQFVALWVIGFFLMPDFLAFMNAGFDGWEQLQRDRWHRYTSNSYHLWVTLMGLAIVCLGLWSNGWYRLNAILLVLCVMRSVIILLLRPRYGT